MKSKKFYISLLVMAIYFSIGLLYYSQLPDVLAVHWNAAGEIDGEMSKPLVLFGIPLLMLTLHIYIVWMTTKDPKYQNIPKIMLNFMYFLIPILSLIIIFITINASIETGMKIDVSMLMSILVSVVIIGVGNYLPKCKQSYTVGIKTPWALDDEENWNKTHRLAGFIWMAVGIILLITNLLMDKSYLVVLFLTAILCMAAIPFGYSYLLFSNKNKQNKKL